jgi:Bacterial mobilisation protein (MobC).
MKKSRGRPLAGADKRLVTVSVRLSPVEAAALDAQRGTRQRGAYLRDVWTRTAPRPIPAINVEAWQELSRVASNLNQIAHFLNSGGRLDIDGLQSDLNELRSALIGAEVPR